jgi:hypothetical protein
MTVIELASIAVTPEAERETLQRIPVEIDERIPVEVDTVITSFAETYAQLAGCSVPATALNTPSPLLARSGACVSKPP